MSLRWLEWCGWTGGPDCEMGVGGESVVSGECGKMVRVFSVLFYLRSFSLHCLFLAFLTSGDTVLV